MSRDAKWLRDEILNLCINNATAGKDGTQFNTIINNFIEQYTPIVWERAILYTDSRHVRDAILRRTSSTYYRYKDKPGNKKPSWERGTIKGNRHKNINWLEVASMHPDLWIDGVQFPRHGAINPNIFDKIYNDFESIYTLFVNWLLTDFSYKALYFIYDISGRYSVDFVNRCMDLVVDKSKRSIEYLSSIMDKENALLREELEEAKQLHDHSKQALKAILDIVSDKSKPIDWDDIENKTKEDAENAKIFGKIKYS